ncbi:MAG: DNA polymerase IV [Planctomycetales bacterium]
MILHVDMDAFYASIEERDRPELAGRPLIVGGTPEGRGVVAAANYVVRKFGVHSAMSTAKALRFCPEAIVLPVRMEHYSEIAERIRDIFFRYTPLVEPLSLDEAFLDVAGSEKLFGSPVEIARRIKRQIREEVGLVASVGVAPNKFLAKIASDLEKPDALVVVEPDRVQAFLDPLPVGRLWGVGRVTGGIFEKLGVRTIADLRRLDPQVLYRHFGRQGEHLWQLAHGIDDRPVVPDREAKSVSHETTFPTDISDREALRAWLLELTEHVGRRLRRNDLRGRTVHLKLRFADFRTITRAHTLPQPTDITREIGESATELLERALPERFAIRLLGVGVSGFENPEQLQQSLFADEDRAKQGRLDAVADEIRAKFGATGLGRGSGMLHDAKHRPEPRPNAER